MKKTRQSYLGLENGVNEIIKRLITEQMAYLKEVVRKHNNYIFFGNTHYDDVFVTFFHIDECEWQVKKINSIFLGKDNRLYLENEDGYAISIFWPSDLSLNDWIDVCDVVNVIDEEICEEED